jgi:hypothetical protein
MKNSSEIIGNRTRDLTACNAVPNQLRHQQRALHLSSESVDLYCGIRYPALKSFFSPAFLYIITCLFSGSTVFSKMIS